MFDRGMEMDWPAELDRREAEHGRDSMMESMGDITTVGGTILGLSARDAIAFILASVVFGLALGAHMQGWW